MTLEARPGPIDSDKQIYSILVPDAIFGSLTEEEMDKKLTLRLGPGNISGLFRILEDESVRIIGGEGPSNPQLRDITLLASIKTTYEVLEAASANKLPVREDILDVYRSFTTAFARRDPTTRAASILLERQRKELDPYTRKLRERESYKVTELPIHIDQLNLISRVLLSTFRDTLGKSWTEGISQYIQSVGFLYRVLIDLRTDRLSLPVRKNYIHLIEAAYDFTALSEQRI